VHGHRLRPVVDREPGARGVAEGADAVVPRVKRVVWVVGREEKNVYEPIEKKRKEKKRKKRKKKKKKQKNGLEWRQDEEQKEDAAVAYEAEVTEKSAA
jgi:hypothetical protein